MSGFGLFGFAALLIPLFFLVLHIIVCVWGYRDCIRRGRSSEFALGVLLGLLFFPVMGLIIYLLIRKN